MADQTKELPKKYPKTFKQCETAEEKIALVRQAMADGHSNKSAAKALGLGKRFGVIAGIRRAHNIPSAHKPSHGKAIESAPEPLPTNRPDKRLTLAGGDWTKQCIAPVDGGQCGWRKIEGENYCPIHLHLKNKK